MKARSKPIYRVISIKQSNGKTINPNRSRTGGILPYRETREYVSRGLLIANYVRTARIFDESNTVAFRRPMMLTNALERAVATREQNVPAQMQPTREDEQNALLSETDSQSKTPPTSIYAVRIVTITPMPPPNIERRASNATSPGAALNQQAEPPRSTYTLTPDRQ